jgi:hypothetical protein
MVGSGKPVNFEVRTDTTNVVQRFHSLSPLLNVESLVFDVLERRPPARLDADKNRANEGNQGKILRYLCSLLLKLNAGSVENALPQTARRRNLAASRKTKTTRTKI